MGKTVFTCRDSNGNPVEDSVTVKLIKHTTPFTEYTGTLDPPAGNSNGVRVFVDLPEDEYDLEFEGVTQSNVSPLFIPGPIVPTAPVLGAGVVDTVNIANDAVTIDKMADDSVGADQIVNGSINNLKLAVDSVPTNAIQGAAVTKSKLNPDVFSQGMKDYLAGGWEPNVDDVKIGYNGSRELTVKAGSIDEAEIVDGAVTASKFGDHSITGIKIGTSAIEAYHISAASIIEEHIATRSITQTKIGTSAIIAEHIADGVLTAIKIGTGEIKAYHIEDGSISGTKIGTGVISANNLDALLQENITIRYPTDMVFVSPQFINNSTPYFDNITDAIDYVVSAGMKTVYIYPGTYQEEISISDSISLIGADPDKCVIQLTPSVGHYIAVNMSSIGSDHIYLNNLTIKCISDHTASVNAIAIKAVDTISKSVILKNVYIKAAGQNSASAPQNAIGIQAYNAKVICDDVYMEVQGGNHLSGGTGANGYGVEITHVDDDISFRGRILAKAGTGGTSGKAYGIKFTAISPHLVIDKSVFETDDETIYAESSVTPVFMSTEYKSAVSSNVQITKFVNVTEDTNVKVKEIIDA